MASNTDLDFLFNPQSVAIVGVSASQAWDNVAGTYLGALLRCDFKGPIYPINPKGGEIQGLRIYAGIKDVPDPLDYVICCIPARSVPQLVKDCAAKGVKAIQFFTSGFGETGTEEGRRLEAEICDLAHDGGIRLVGPNCMGIYCPRGGLSFTMDCSKESGPVAFICQSGGNAIYFTRHAAQRGVRFSKVVSYGNAADVTESDLLDYLAADPESGIIAVYIEGVRDGKRFGRALREAAKVKPVIVMKGGCTEAGARAAASHTGALAGSARIWGGLLRQAGVIPVATLEELADMFVTFLYLPVPQGRRLGSIHIGGGAAVVATDSWVSAGLVLPSLPQEMQDKLGSFLSTRAGVSLNNPVDLARQFYSPAVYSVVKALAEYSGIDIIVVHFPLGTTPVVSSFPKESAFPLLDNVTRVHRETRKPMVVVIDQLATAEAWETAFACQQKCHQAGIPVYFSMNSAARAISRFLCYHEHRGGWQADNGGPD